ncbi:probable serine/threonine-protein kinase MARK-A [Melanotaenia boesemani]|uniref:probable serine/threonine-protein kinase MARK-A n=1 Tax=Melanotaenia boesemani TaxID=1250792 RepID=UPI001C05371C|nr:probable serine/threonine-protein kinase MARK-A [Melanotaenia boesemani]
MERYEPLGQIGEGSYGTVLKCRHRDSGRLVAIKKFLDSDDDKTVKKIALREIKLLRQLRHDNLVNLLEVWKRRRRWHLVFEFVDRTLLDDLEQHPSGLGLNTSRQYLYQILRAADFCHQQNVIHRDIKPENILISQGGVVKLCDFGFARTMASSSEGAVYTDYVATRWYRAPELLVGDIKYGKPVDVWAVGCLLIEMLTGQPLFPGDSDLDQLYHIVKCFGNLVTHHQELFYRNPVFSGVRLPECSATLPLLQRFPTITPTGLGLAQRCLEVDPDRRAQCSELLEHPLFTQDSFHIRFLDELNAKIQKEHRENSTLPKITKIPRQDREEGNEKNRRGKDRKQPEDMDERVNKEKMEKAKGKQLSKISKTIRTTSEPLTTKQSKTLGNKGIHNAAQSSMPVKSKPGKVAGAESKKESEISKSTKTTISESADATRTTSSLKGKISVTAKGEHKISLSPEPSKDHLKNINEMHSSGSDIAENKAQSMMKIRRLSKSEPSQEFAKSWSSTNSKVSKNSTNVQQNLSLSSKAASESAVNQTDAWLEYSEISNKDNMEDSAPKLLTVTKLSKMSAASEFKTNHPAGDTELRTSGCPKDLPSSPKASKTTSNGGSKTKNNASFLSTNPVKTLTSGASEEPSTIFRNSSPALPKEISHPKVSKTNMTSTTPSKARELIEEKNIEEDHGLLKRSPVTETIAMSHIPMSHSPGGDPQSTSCASWASGKITKEDIKTSTFLLDENILVEFTDLKALKVSEQENQEDLVFPLSISSASRSLGNDKRHKSTAFEPDAKSFKVPHPKQILTKPGSFINHKKSTETPKTQKTTFVAEAKKNDNPERIDTTVSAVTDLTSVTSEDHKAPTRSFILNNVDATDLNKFDFIIPQSPTPSPPPPPSSTPFLFHPSSTTFMSSLSIFNTNNEVATDHLSQGASFHPGTQSHRCVDKTRHHGGMFGRQAHISGSFTFQASENSLVRDRSFLSDHCNLGNSSVAMAKNKSHIHFPDLRSSDLRGKPNKCTAKDQKRDKHPGPSSLPSEAQKDINTNKPKQTQ